MGFTYNDYAESDAVKKKREEAEKYKQYVASQSVNDAKSALDLHEQNKVADWTGGTYGESLKVALDRINNREKFTYDLNGDALYQQYKDQYINQGKLAMQDTMGQAAAMTGGYGNSYAATVGNQAYQGYLQKLNDVVPELYNLALNKYNLEGQDLKDQYSLLRDQYNTEYGQHRDKVGDWNTEAARLSDKYYNESNLDYSRYADNRDYHTNEYNTERSYDYGLYSDAYNRAFSQYQQAEAERQAAEELKLKQAQMAQSARQHQQSLEAQYRAAGYTKDANGNWVAPEKQYFLEEYEDDRLRGYFDDENWSAAYNYIAYMENKGLSEKVANDLYSVIPDEVLEKLIKKPSVGYGNATTAKKVIN
jgi:hypothetical protein